jgi:hypothetical protein
VRGVLTHPHIGKRAGLLGGPFVDDLPPGVAAGLFQQMLNRNATPTQPPALVRSHLVSPPGAGASMSMPSAVAPSRP